jgi:hypothetical protein
MYIYIHIIKMMVKHARVKTCSKSHPEKRNIEKDGKGIPKIENRKQNCLLQYATWHVRYVKFFQSLQSLVDLFKGLVSCES